MYFCILSQMYVFLPFNHSIYNSIIYFLCFDFVIDDNAASFIYLDQVHLNSFLVFCLEAKQLIRRTNNDLITQ